ncbi:MAG: nicotinate-nucleotide--dimethylbenzimidazole phosphoribosyltransferase [Smithellaceae bacterium]
MKKIEDTILSITHIDSNAMVETQKKLDNLTKPKQSLGNLEDFARRIAGITGKLISSLKEKTIFTMAGDHGIAHEGVSLFPQEVTEQMIYNFLNGSAAVNVLAKHIGARVVVVDMGAAVKIKTESKNFIDKKIAFGTKNIAIGPAMSKDEAIKSIEAGIEVFEKESIRGWINIVGLGEMGIANTTAASAITSCITGAAIEDVTGRGTGISDEQLATKIKLIRKALTINKPDHGDPIDVLEKLGGFEIGGLVGLILAAAAERIPVVIDGFITASAALIATEIAPLTKEYLFASHNSVEKGHNIALRWMGLEPMFDLKMRLGEGTGACLGISMIEAGVKILTEMATFENARVSREKK